MFKNLLVIVAILGLVACKSKYKSNDTSYSDASQQEQQEQQGQQFEEIGTAEEASAINSATQKDIEEVEVKDRVLFSYDSSELTSEAKAVLDLQAEWLKSDGSIDITIEGHCDEKGTREYNIALGERRANAAKTYLVNKGILDSRIKTISYGKERPAFFGDSAETMSKNRRAVTITE